MNVQSRIEIPDDLSVETFFRWAERQLDRYELVRGKPRLLPWVQFNHNRIVVNLTRIFASALDPASFEVATGDFALKVGDDSIRYADLMIVAAGKPGDIRFVDDARLVVEVLSKSTMHIHFGEKLDKYRKIASVRTYIVFSQKPAEVWVWSRRPDGTWPEDPEVVSDILAIVDVPDLGLSLPLVEVYRNVA